MKISLRDVIEFLFLPVMTAGVFVLWDLNKGVSQLNVQVAILIAEKTSTDDKIKAIEKRVEKLEDKISK
jgi:hypothetical protein